MNYFDELKNSYNEFPHKSNKVVKRREIIEFYKNIREILFYNFYHEQVDYDHIDKLIEDARHRFLNFEKIDDFCEVNYSFEDFLNDSLEIKSLLISDVKAMYEGDPACNSFNEVIMTYPGFVAISAYRIAHVLYVNGFRFAARVISEYAHSRTGIDINPGAQIDESLCIDHGTGIVVGETCVIGKNCKIYQGVTLGALSLKDGRKLKDIKRHPTIEDNVTIYSGASIFGGNTIIGKNSIIGSNVFITKSIPENSKVILEIQDMKIVPIQGKTSK